MIACKVPIAWLIASLVCFFKNRTYCTRKMTGNVPRRGKLRWTDDANMKLEREGKCSALFGVGIF